MKQLRLQYFEEFDTAYSQVYVEIHKSMYVPDIVGVLHFDSVLHIVYFSAKASSAMSHPQRLKRLSLDFVRAPLAPGFSSAAPSCQSRH